MVLTQNEVNLHTHSFYCKHGSGTIADYVAQAEKDGLKVLGFSEHCPLPDREFCKGERMDYPELPLYEKDVLEAKKNSRIRILLGAECDVVPGEESFYKDDLLGRRGYDYISCAIHNMIDPNTGKNTYFGRISAMTVKMLSEYVDLYTTGLASGMFLFGCHPDLVFAGYRKWDENAKAASMDIIRCAKQYNMPLEINDYGLRKPEIDTPDGRRHAYPHRKFWELAAAEGVCTITNSDAHRAVDVAAHKIRAKEFAASLGIEPASYEIDENGKIKIVKGGSLC